MQTKTEKTHKKTNGSSIYTVEEIDRTKKKELTKRIIIVISNLQTN